VKMESAKRAAKTSVIQAKAGSKHQSVQPPASIR
jgi:hypothetical protein